MSYQKKKSVGKVTIYIVLKKMVARNVSKNIFLRKQVKKMMPLESSIKDQKLYCKRVLKWYEKIWYFLTGKKNKAQKLGKIEYIGVDEEW